MIITSLNELKKISFPDVTVDYMTTDTVNKVCEIFLNGAVIDEEKKLIEAENAKLIIKSWQSIHVKAYEFDTISSWINIELTQIEPLKDICEEIFDNDITLRGFGSNSGLWLEFQFIKPQAVFAEVNIKNFSRNMIP